MLIDAGDRGSGDRVVEYLKDNDIEELDTVVATHAHADHIGGMPEVLNNFYVKQFIDSGNPHTTKTFENMLIAIDEKDIPFSLAEAGQTINLDPSTTITVLNPAELTGDINDDSVVLRITYGDVSFMFTGDAETHAEDNIVAAEYDIDSDILKVAHHGSVSSTSPDFLELVNPEVCIIMVGADNRYGHPHQEIIDRLNLFGCEIYRTDLDGNVVVKTDGREYSVETQTSGLVIPMTAMTFAMMVEA
ncbi:competence protein [Methanolobus halotolerans]|uniref:Competence protein n=2 Tax=Methanolobus halotolerans TaxID=2052935 RepID=A0A4E0Q2J5_9EURY|nr:competence protein [Methanolobus halotolerans]